MQAKKVAQNLIKSHGISNFLTLIRMFQSNESGSKIAKKFSVSRQRVHQWRKALGITEVTFTPSSEVAEIIGVPSTFRTTI